MGLVMYTLGVVSIVVGCFQLINVIIQSHDLMCNIVVCIMCIIVGIITALDGISVMKKR